MHDPLSNPTLSAALHYVCQHFCTPKIKTKDKNFDEEVITRWKNVCAWSRFVAVTGLGHTRARVSRTPVRKCAAHAPMQVNRNAKLKRECASTREDRNLLERLHGTKWSLSNAFFNSHLFIWSLLSVNKQ